MDTSASLSIKVIKAPNQCLRVKTKSVKKITPQLLKVTAQMIKLTKTFVDPEGVGLASTQIGEIEQFFVFKSLDGFKAIFNPKIISYGKKLKKFFEGCLSIPDYYGEIKRPTLVEVSYLDKNGKEVRQKLKGVEAWIFQHEIDHLNGRLFMDLVLEQKSRLFKVVGKDRAGAEIFEEVKL